jgi:hypothetical protein
MCRFEMVFQSDDVASNMGSAWVGVNYQLGGPQKSPVVTQDCGTPQEFERAIRVLQAELDDVLRRGKARFASNWQAKMARTEGA